MFGTRRLFHVAALALLMCTQPVLAAPAEFEAEIQSYERQDSVAAPPAGQVVVTGSSSIVLWGSVASDLSPLAVIPRGFGGSTAADLDYFLDRIVIKYAPRAVVIYEGDNDVGAGVSPDAIANTMRGILGRISARFPNARVYVIAVKLSPLRVAAGQAAQVRQVNQLYAALCASDARYTYIDIMSPLLGTDGAPVPAYFHADGLHLSALGYLVWTAAVRPIVVPQQQAPAPYDASAPTLPGSLVATSVSSSRVDLRWAGSSDNFGGVGLAGYRIWRDGQPLATTTATSFSDTGLQASTSYTYNVSAYDRAQPQANESVRSGPAFATTASAGALPVVRLSAAAATVASGSSTQLTWSVTDATSCTASGAWSGARGTSGVQQTAALAATAVYTLTCTGPGGTGSGSVTVAVVTPPASVSLWASAPSVASGGTVQLTWSSSQATSCSAGGGWSGGRATSGSAQTGPLTTATTFTLNCSGPGGSGAASTTVTILPAPVVTLTASAASVARNGTVTLNWTSLNATGCTAAGGWSGSKATSGSLQTGSLTAVTTFMLTCSGAGGSDTATTVVTILPTPVVTFTATSPSVVRGGAVTLNWTSLNATGCSASGDWSGAVAPSGAWQTPALAARKSYLLTCAGPGGSTAAIVVVDVTYPPPAVSLAASPATVVSGAGTTLRWTATDADSCTASNAWSGTRPLAGEESTAPLLADATFALTCTGPAGVAVTSEVVVSVTPPLATATVPSANGTAPSAGSTTQQGGATIQSVGATSDSASNDNAAGNSAGGGGGATRWLDLGLLAWLFVARQAALGYRVRRRH